MKIIVRGDDGSEVDVTSGVQAVYDCAESIGASGSGLYDSEELAAILTLAQAAGFAEPYLPRNWNEES